MNELQFNFLTIMVGCMQAGLCDEQNVRDVAAEAGDIPPGRVEGRHIRAICIAGGSDGWEHAGLPGRIPVAVQDRVREGRLVYAELRPDEQHEYPFWAICHPCEHDALAFGYYIERLNGHAICHHERSELTGRFVVTDACLRSAHPYEGEPERLN